MKKAIVLLLTLVLLQGCAAVQWVEDHPTTAGIAVRWALMKQVGEDTGKAQEIYDVATKLQGVGNWQWATVEEFEAVTRRLIPWDKMDRADRMAANEFLAITRGGLAEMVGRGALGPDEKVRVASYIDWVRETAVLLGAER